MAEKHEIDKCWYHRGNVKYVLERTSRYVVSPRGSKISGDQMPLIRYSDTECAPCFQLRWQQSSAQSCYALLISPPTCSSSRLIFFMAYRLYLACWNN